jgi:Holliday junction resolvase
MVNPPRKKGTGYETELVNAFEAEGYVARRMEAGHRFDIEVLGPRLDPINVLATRPDRGRTLVTVSLEDLFRLIPMNSLHVEAKRYKRFALHTLYEEKFG